MERERERRYGITGAIMLCLLAETLTVLAAFLIWARA